MSIEYGILPLCAEAFLIYSWNVGIALKQDIRQAYEWGHLGLLLCQKLYSQIKLFDRGRIWFLYYGSHPYLLCTTPFNSNTRFVFAQMEAFISFYEDPMRVSLDYLKSSIKDCVEVSGMKYLSWTSHQLVFLCLLVATFSSQEMRRMAHLLCIIWCMLNGFVEGLSLRYAEDRGREQRAEVQKSLKWYQGKIQ